MATVYSDTAQLQLNAASLLTGVATRAEGKSVGGELLMLSATYTTDGTETLGTDIIAIGTLPVGAVVIPALSHIATEAVGGTTPTLDIGDSTTATRYASALDASSAATVSFDTNMFTPFTITAATQDIIATTHTSGNPTAGQIITFNIAYKVSR
jgi:hypothetical protein